MNKITIKNIEIRFDIRQKLEFFKIWLNLGPEIARDLMLYFAWNWCCFNLDLKQNLSLRHTIRSSIARSHMRTFSYFYNFRQLIETYPNEILDTFTILRLSGCFSSINWDFTYRKQPNTKLNTSSKIGL